MKAKRARSDHAECAHCGRCLAVLGPGLPRPAPTTRSCVLEQRLVLVRTRNQFHDRHATMRFVLARCRPARPPPPHAAPSLKGCHHTRPGFDARVLTCVLRGWLHSRFWFLMLSIWPGGGCRPWVLTAKILLGGWLPACFLCSGPHYRRPQRGRGPGRDLESGRGSLGPEALGVEETQSSCHGHPRRDSQAIGLQPDPHACTSII